MQKKKYNPEEALSWVKNELKVGQVVNGTVKSVQKYGAFIEINGGVVALLHIEDISVARIKSPLERFSIGEKINVMVKSIDKETGRIFLTYKELLRNMGRKCKRFFRRNNCYRNCKRNRKKLKWYICRIKT